jgi:hypothetical protein
MNTKKIRPYSILGFCVSMEKRKLSGGVLSTIHVFDKHSTSTSECMRSEEYQIKNIRIIDNFMEQQMEDETVYISFMDVLSYLTCDVTV